MCPNVTNETFFYFLERKVCLNETFVYLSTMNNEQTTIAALRRQLKLAQAERDLAKRNLTTTRQNLQARTSEADALKKELQDLKMKLTTLAK